MEVRQKKERCNIGDYLPMLQRSFFVKTFAKSYKKMGIVLNSIRKQETSS